jgi:hypothetical protein
MATTDWGAVEAEVIARLISQITTTDSRTVKSALSEKKADEFSKGINSIFTVNRGSTARDSGRSGNGYLRQDEEWAIQILIYSASGKVQDVDRRAIQTLAAKVKAAINGYTPPSQVDDNQCLRLRRDEPVEEYSTVASMGLKIRQTYVLPCLLNALVV